MIKEDFYIELLNPKSLSGVPPGVLGNYEIALLYLQRFGTVNLPEENCRELSLEAFGVWAQCADRIDLIWDVPELISRIPEKVLGCLYLNNSQIQELSNLKKVVGDLDLRNSQIQELPKLKEVRKYIFVYDLSY